MIAWSSSAPSMEPMETTLRSPPRSPTGFRSGVMRTLPVASSLSASTRSVNPSSRGIENPPMSASSTPTVSPRLAMAIARWAVTEDLPTPPFPEEMATTRAVAGMSMATSSRSVAFHRARSISDRFWSAVISPNVTLTCSGPPTAGMPPTWARTSFMSWDRSGQPAVVREIRTSNRPSSSGPNPATMPRSTTLSPSSGSITPRSALVTASSVMGTSRFYRLSLVKI